MRSHHTPFHSGCTIWPSRQKYRIPISPGPGQLLLFSVFLIIVILWGMMKWYLTVVLILSSLMTSDVEHSWFCLLAICLSSVDRCILNSSAHILMGLFDFPLLDCRSPFYILDINLWSYIWLANIFSHSVGCFLTLLLVSFDVQKVSFLNFGEDQFIYFFLFCCAFGIISKKSLSNSISWRFSLCVFLRIL